MGKTVGKTDLAHAIAVKSGMTPAAAALAIDSVTDAIKERVGQGDTVQIKGFGSFQVKAHKARTARNPRTGEAVPVPEHNKLHFKPSKAT